MENVKVKVGKPRYIVSPGVVEVIIQEDRGKQAKFEWRARGQTFDDLPQAQIFFVGIGPHEIEVPRLAWLQLRDHPQGQYLPGGDNLAQEQVEAAAKCV